MVEGLNPLSIGSVFPTAGWVDADMSMLVLIPFLSGLFFQHIIGEKTMFFAMVLIPFLSGLFFQRPSSGKPQHPLGLNPLSIGSVFPTPFIAK